MRCSVSFLSFLVALLASPLGVSAQGTDKGWVEEFYPELAPREAPQPPPQESAPKAPASEPAPREPALELRLDDARVEVVPSPPQTPDEYALMTRRVKRAKIGLGVSAYVVAAGASSIALSFACWRLSADVDCLPRPVRSLLITGVTFTAVGVAGIIASAALLATRKRKLRKLERAHHGTTRRVHWDLARSRLVF